MPVPARSCWRRAPRRAPGAAALGAGQYGGGPERRVAQRGAGNSCARLIAQSRQCGARCFVPDRRSPRVQPSHALAVPLAAGGSSARCARRGRSAQRRSPAVARRSSVWSTGDKSATSAVDGQRRGRRTPRIASAVCPMRASRPSGAERRFRRSGTGATVVRHGANDRPCATALSRRTTLEPIS
jgi:hypothetical protein